MKYFLTNEEKILLTKLQKNLFNIWASTDHGVPQKRFILNISKAGIRIERALRRKKRWDQFKDIGAVVFLISTIFLGVVTILIAISQWKI